MGEGRKDWANAPREECYEPGGTGSDPPEASKASQSSLSWQGIGGQPWRQRDSGVGRRRKGSRLTCRVSHGGQLGASRGRSREEEGEIRDYDNRFAEDGQPQKCKLKQLESARNWKFAFVARKPPRRKAREGVLGWRG